MNILNLVNFVRGVDPRYPDLDLLLPVQKQLELTHKYKFPTTFLLQNEVLTDKRFIDILKPSELIEIGLWFELNKNLVERAGEVWKGQGESILDWHPNAGFPIGYSPESRLRMIDIAMEDFKEVYGYYPKTVASWFIDVYTLKYLYDKYGIEASMNCKDQWDTDGYSLWGGYYNQAFYPSVHNAFCPANSKETQIDVPIFRMLGSDPMDQYDCESDHNGQNVISLEPVWTESGGNKEWVQWFLGEIFNGKSLSFGYTQAGQENTFGWHNFGEAYIMQMEYIDQLRAKNVFTMMTVSEAGRWFKQEYPLTPASSIVCYKGDRTSIWFCNRWYRTNLYEENDKLLIRDLFLFKDDYRERYIDSICDNTIMYFDNLPVLDSYRTSTSSEKDGAYFTVDGEAVRVTGTITTEEKDKKELYVHVPTNAGEIEIALKEDIIEMHTSCNLTMVWTNANAEIMVEGKCLKLKYQGYQYEVELECKEISIENIHDAGRDYLKVNITPEQEKILIKINN